MDCLNRTLKKVQDTNPLVITIVGEATIKLIIEDTYNDAGATAADDMDGDISASIAIAGDTVDTSTAGTYVITYNVADIVGNIATEVTRTVIVSPVPPE